MLLKIGYKKEKSKFIKYEIEWCTFLNYSYVFNLLFTENGLLKKLFS